MQKVEYSNQGVNQKIFIEEDGDFTAEQKAMLQAFYSRSTVSIEDRLETLGDTKEKIAESLKKFYIGYGHKSVGQGSDVVVFFEDVSILAAKMIQNNPLYAGQETSTRYYDFTERPFIDPINFHGFHGFIVALYKDILSLAKEALKETAAEDVKQAAIDARAFDIARAFLTPGFTTKLSWKGSFDNIQEHLTRLLFAPSDEVSKLASVTLAKLHSVYPNAFEHPEPVKARIEAEGSSFCFFDNTTAISTALKEKKKSIQVLSGDTSIFLYSFDSVLGLERADSKAFVLAENRKKNSMLPRNFAAYGTFTFEFDIDYGSYRDLQRHRNGICYFPSYSNQNTYHMNSWYMKQLNQLGILHKEVSGELKAKLSLLFSGQELFAYGYKPLTYADVIEQVCKSLIPKLKETLKSKPKLNLNGYSSNRFLSVEEQEAALMYYVPMGINLRAIMRYDLPQALYVAELRSGKTVHPTARSVAQCMLTAIKEKFKNIAIYGDSSPDEGINKRRGEQTILVDGKPIQDKPKLPVISAFVATEGSTEEHLLIVAVDSEHKVLSSHVSSSIHFGKTDIQAPFHQAIYKDKYPDGYTMIWLDKQPVEFKLSESNNP